MEQTEQVLCGAVERVVFRNEENGWTVLELDTGDEAGSIRVRLRSRFVHINGIAEKYRGGGHACASGATVYGMDEVNALLKDADALLKDYKATHEGWL